MEEILCSILQFLLEIAIEVLTFLPFDWPSRNRKTPEPDAIALRCGIWFCAGCAIGAGSLGILPRTLIEVSWLRIVNVICAPGCDHASR